MRKETVDDVHGIEDQTCAACNVPVLGLQARQGRVEETGGLNGSHKLSVRDGVSGRSARSESNELRSSKVQPKASMTTLE